MGKSEFVHKKEEGRTQFDVEGVVNQSYPHVCTAESSSATKNLHKKKKPVEVFDGVQPYIDFSIEFNCL